jgi:hypothetical protein
MRAKLAALFALTTLGSAPYAHATAGSITYYGVVAATQIVEPVLGRTEPANDYDVASLFGGPSVNLEGDKMSATFNYNNYEGVETYAPGMFDEIDGGLGGGAGDSITSVIFSVQVPYITVDGSTVTTTYTTYNYTFSPNYLEDTYTSAAFIQDYAYSTPNLDGTGGAQISANITPDIAGPTNLAESFASTGFGPNGYLITGVTEAGLQDTIAFDIDRVSVSAAPEPSTWALSILGVALAGGALRVSSRRRQVAA